MSFDEIAARVNSVCLSTFGQEFTLKRFATGTTETITGILEAGVLPEENAPGDGSVYASLWVRAADLATAPQRGDEVSSSTTVYKVLDIERDVDGGLRMQLRMDRDA